MMRVNLPSALLLSSSFLDRHVAKRLTRSSSGLTPSDIRTRVPSSRRVRARSASAGQTNVEIEDVAEYLSEGVYKRVLVVAGAGVSCSFSPNKLHSAGIPDFRTPGSGLYSNLHEYRLPYPEAIFELDFFRQNTQPFVTLAKEIWPGVKYLPTITHCFFSLLDRKGLLQRLYTQNIDGLEAVAGVNPERLVEAHGHFRSAGCIECGTAHDPDDCKASMLERGEAPECETCGGQVKPSIVFFGEVMPTRFSDLVDRDTATADLVIVLGTSLLVAPICMIPDWVGNECHRLLINRDPVGSFRGASRDVFVEGDCDENVRKLCKMTGWDEELEQIYSQTRAK